MSCPRPGSYSFRYLEETKETRARASVVALPRSLHTLPPERFTFYSVKRTLIGTGNVCKRVRGCISRSLQRCCRLCHWRNCECIKPLYGIQQAKGDSIMHTNALSSFLDLLSAKCTEAYKSRDSVRFIRPCEWFSLPKARRFAPTTTKNISRFGFRDNVIDWRRTNSRQLDRREWYCRELGDHGWPVM